MSQLKKYFICHTTICMLMLSLCGMNTFAQSIRKNYREMTAKEREVYVGALNTLYNTTPNIINNYVLDHRAPAQGGFAQHGNVNFLAWHRMYLYYFEKELKGVNSKINLPYWDWTVTGDWVGTSLLFQNSSAASNGIMGFNLNSAWLSSLSLRWFSGAAQPTSLTINSLVNTSSFTSFRNSLEAGPHGNANCWVGGTMCDIATSPRDPIFYLHHNMVDKVWQDWTNLNWNGLSLGISTNLGTVTNKPAIDGNSIIDSKVLKTWYANNNQVNINKYTVDNMILGQSIGVENYTYTGNIILAQDQANYFIVPNGKSANVITATSITLKPGFKVEAGGAFTAKIDLNHFNSARQMANNDFEMEETFIDNSMLINIYPNPAKEFFYISANLNAEYTWKVIDGLGKIIATGKFTGYRSTEIPTSGMQQGLYLIEATNLGNNKSIRNKMIVE